MGVKWNLKTISLVVGALLGVTTLITWINSSFSFEDKRVWIQLVGVMVAGLIASIVARTNKPTPQPGVSQEAIIEALKKSGVKEAELEKINEELKVKLAETEAKLKEKGATEALKHFKQGDYDKAEELFKGQAEGTHQAAEANYYLGNIAFARLRFREAAEYYEKAVSLEPENSGYLNAVGMIWIKLGEYRKAIGYYERALAIDKKAYGDEHHDVARDLNNIGAVWCYLGEYSKAIEHYKRALEIGTKVSGEDHDKVAILLSNIGGAWVSLGEYKKAIEYYERALSIVKKTYGEGHLNVAGSLNNIGTAWGGLCEYNRAIDYYERALVILSKFLDENHPNMITLKQNLANARAALEIQGQQPS